MVVATASQQKAANCFACGCVAVWRVVFVAFSVKKILTDSCRVVTTVYAAMTQQFFYYRAKSNTGEVSPQGRIQKKLRRGSQFGNLGSGEHIIS